MIRLCGALAALALLAAHAQASESFAWSPDREASTGFPSVVVDGAPWGDPWTAAAIPPTPDDAYAFGDVAQGAGLSQDAFAAAVRFDIERLARPTGGTSVQTSRTPDLAGRVAGAFAGFVQIGTDGLTYASIGFMDGRGDRGSPPNEASLEPAVLAMTSPDR